jgi:hypothetical protein
MRLATHAWQPGRASASPAHSFDNQLDAIGVDRLREDLRIADSVGLDDEGMSAGVARQKDDPSRIAVVPKPLVGVDPRWLAGTQVDVENRRVTRGYLVPSATSSS